MNNNIGPIIPIYNNINFLLNKCEGLILDIWGVLWDVLRYTQM